MSLYIRNIIFGVEDSLVSTVGLLSGIAVAGTPHGLIITTGFVLIAVEAVSMAIGSFLSEESAEEYESGKKANTLRAVLGALIMLASYLIAGLVPLSPYFILEGYAALGWSIGLSLVLLLVLGYMQARASKLPPLSRALRMGLLGGFAIIVGVVVATVFEIA
jgi:VIT1/CCC1 family predicted Fe2+/Mn2+ transporter